MEYKKHFQTLLKYDLWANQKIINTILDNALSEGRPLEVLSHIINSETIWLGRIKNDIQLTDPFKIANVLIIPDLLISANKNWIEFIDSLSEEDFFKEIDYKNNRGEQSKSAIWEIITHMINHSTHHRAQIGVEMKRKGVKVPPTDFIAFTRLNK